MPVRERSAANDPFLDGAGHFSGVTTPLDCSGRSAAIIGGAVGGLAAAHALNVLGYDVELYERQSFATKRVNCGEAITAASTIPLVKTSDNGFLNDTPAFEIYIYNGVETTRQLIEQGEFRATDGYIMDRNIVERQWAEQLAHDGVEINEGASITKSKFRSLASTHDLLVDATGQPSLTSKVTETTHEYTGHMTALNTNVEGDFSNMYPKSRFVLESDYGYVWAFPKTSTRANVGIMWWDPHLPKNYMAAFEAACERNGWPIPTREQTNIAIIPEGPSLNPTRTYVSEYNIVQVGDAAGIANRFSGKGMSQAIHSSYLMASLAAQDQLTEYPKRLYAMMRSEYRLAYLVRGILESKNPGLLGDVLTAVSGLDAEDADRSPHAVINRLIRHPVLLGRLIAQQEVRRRGYNAYINRWK